MNINLSDLSKEQKQYILLGAIGILGVGGALILGVRFSISSLAEARTELEDLTVKVERAEKELSRKVTTRDELYETIAVLEDYLNHVPPEENHYSWATEIVYSKGRKAGLEVQSVDEVGMSRGKTINEADPAYFETYSLRINASGGYAQVKAFLLDIEKSHPLVRCTGIEISSSGNPDFHNVQLFVQWPFKLERIALLFEEEAKKSKALMALKAERGIKDEPKPASGQEPAVVVAEPADKPVVKAAPVVAVKKPTPPTTKPVRAAPTPPPEVKPDPIQQFKAAAVVKAPTPPVTKPAPVKPAPVIAAAPTPKPAPKPVVREPVPVRSEPAIEPPAPVVAAAPAEPPKAPVVQPEPVVEKPKPAVVQAPVVIPEPAPVPAVEKPAPAIAAESSPPADENSLDSILASIDKIQQPDKQPAQESAPAVVKPEPVVASVPKPSVKESNVDSILASIDRIEQSSNNQEPAEEPDEMSTLLASLASRGNNDVSVQDPETASQDDLAAYVQALESQPKAAPAAESVVVEPVAPVEPAAPAVAVVEYRSTGRSAKILEELLMEDKPKAGATLGSFLDGLVEDIK